MEHPSETGRDRILALDGLRGLAVAGVLAFHTGADWARGGFLGVSAFFTLSGFLICTLLVEEHHQTGRIDLRRFWARRARRLLPAALAALFGVLVFATFVGAPSDLAGVRADVVAALAYVANWRFVASAQSYADLFRAPSPAQHFWSLAIEEQFYVVFPVTVVGAAWVGRRIGRVRRTIALAVLALLSLSIAAAVLAGPDAGADPSRSYYGTDVRAAELLVGAGLAVVGARRRLWSVFCVAIAPLALVGVLWSWHVVGQTDGRLYDGGLLVHALAVAVLIVAAHGGGVTSRVLAWLPLRWLGRISYAAYLYHWPIFLWLSPARVGVDGWVLSAVRLGVTLSLAEASTRWLEEPVRSGRRLRRPKVAGLTAAGAMASVGVVAGLAGATVVPPATPGPVSSVAAAMPVPTAPLASIATIPVSADATTSPLRVYVAGDSVALRLGLHLQRWGEADGRIRVWPSGWLACAAARGGTYRYAGVAKPLADRCNRWPEIRAAELDEIRPDVVVVSFGVFDVLDRRLPGSDRWQHLGEPGYDDHVRGELAALQQVLSSRGARVVWLTSSYVKTGGNETGYRPSTPFPEWDHARMDRFNDLVREVAAASSAASVIELQRHLQAEWGDDEDPGLRPDGVHPSIPASDRIAEWLAPQLLGELDRVDHARR